MLLPDVMEAQNLIYQPLQGSEIRLVKFKKSLENSGVVELQLEHFEIKKAPPFLALSYVWGDPIITRPVNVNEVPFGVTTNLHDAIVQIHEITAVFEEGISRVESSNSTELFLWIDAISIDQHNTDEKSKQIIRMAEIYSSAFTVLIWLGKRDTFESAETLAFGVLVDTFHNISPLLEFSRPEIVYTLPEDWKQSDLIQLMVLVYSIILQRDWFDRKWVLQESALAQRKPCVLLGEAFFSLQALYDFRKAVLAFREHPDELTRTMVGQISHVALTLSTQAFGATNLRDLIATKDFQEKSPAKQLLSIIIAQTSKSCSVLHDHIYGLLGMVNLGQLSEDLVPDYRKPFGEVCKAYARFIIEQTRDLRLLMCSKLKTDNIEFKGQPSWVPNFEHMTGWQAEPATFHTGSFSEDGETLIVEGVKLGRIRMHFAGSYDAAEKSLQQFNDTLIEAAAGLRQQATSQVWKEWFATFLFDECDHFKSHADRFQSAEDFINDSPTEVIDSSGQILARQWVFQKFSGCEFYLTDDGEIRRYHGYSHVESADELLMIACKGSTQPSVVRSDGTGHYYNMGWLRDTDFVLNEAFFEARKIEPIALK